MKNILLIGATHGNEAIGVEALRELEKKNLAFDWIIGNPKAFELNTREFEGDLNLQEFTPITVDSEIYFPLLIGSYTHQNISCYKMRKISPPILPS